MTPGARDPDNERRTINDPGSTRASDADADVGSANGLVRSLARFDEDGDGTLESNESIVSFTCPLVDTFSARVAPAS